MKPLVEFCSNNLTSDMLEIKKKLENQNKVDVMEYGCLGFCGICASGPYALVDGEMTKADSAEELFEKIIKSSE